MLITTAYKNDAIATIKETVIGDPRLSTRALAEMTGIPHKSVWRTLTINLQMHRLSAYWVPQNLTEQQRMNRVLSAQGIIHQLTGMGELRYDLYAVEDETWVNFDIQHTTSSAKQWLPQGIPRPTVVSSKLTPRKCLVMVAFCPSKRFSVKALPYGVTVDGDVYRDFVQNTGHKWQCLRTNPVNLSNLVWQHDNARPHTRKDVASFFQWRKITLLKQAPYSPDLNLCDRWLFAHVKKTPSSTAVQLPSRGGRCIFPRVAFNYCGCVSETSGSSDFTLPEGDCRPRGLCYAHQLTCKLSLFLMPYHVQL